MASIYKRPNCETYQCQFYVKDPATGELQKVRKSTGITNKKKAQAMADEWERAAKGVIQAGSDREQQARAILSEAVREIGQERFTAPTARKYLAQLLAVATGEKLDTYTVDSWCQEWLRRKAQAKSSTSTMARYTGHVESFLAWLGPQRRFRPLEAVTSQHVREWRELLLGEGRTGKTVAGYVKDVAGIYAAAIREGITGTNPAKALEAVSTDDSQERKPFTLEEVARLLAAAPNEEWRGLILAAAFTGLRLGDAARLSWETIDLQAKKITLIPQKGKKKKKRVVYIPIQSDLLAYLEELPIANHPPGAPVFPRLSETRVGDRTGLSQTFNKIMAAAGVDRGKPSRVIKDGEKRGAGRITYERGFHSFRHTFTSWLRNAGVSEEDRMALTGHSTRESHQIYSHADEAAGRAAIEKLPTLKKAKP
jgi:integrase